MRKCSSSMRCSKIIFRSKPPFEMVSTMVSTAISRASLRTLNYCQINRQLLGRGLRTERHIGKYPTPSTRSGTAVSGAVIRAPQLAVELNALESAIDHRFQFHERILLRGPWPAAGALLPG